MLIGFCGDVTHEKSSFDQCIMSLATDTGELQLLRVNSDQVFLLHKERLLIYYNI